MGRLYLVRHGRTAWNKGEVFRGTADVPLDDVGREQGRLVGEALKTQARRAARILSSPLSRAMETASIIAEAFAGVSAEADDRLTDIDVGEWSGVSLEEVSRRYPGQYQGWALTPHLFRFPGGQMLREVQEQAWQAVRDAAPLLADSDVILVSHRLTLKALALKAVGAGLEHFWKVRLDTGSISVLELGEAVTGDPDAGSRLVLSRLNDVSHLAPLRLQDRIDF